MNAQENFHEKCILCHSPSIILLQKYSKDYLVKCKHCGLVFSQKIPTNEELYNYYQKYTVRNDYYISPITLNRYREILHSLESFRQTNRILDVGCGHGAFLSVAKEMGWDAYGVELSETLTNYCRQKGFKVLHGSLEKNAERLPIFDLIISNEVIEHINTPNTEVQLFYKLLRNGGAVYVATPNFNSLLRFFLKNKYNVIWYPEHLTYFTPKTLTYTFKRNGFSKKWLITTGISISRLVNSNKSIEHSENPYSPFSKDEKLRKAAEEKWLFNLTKKIINSLLSLTGTGLTIKGLFLKHE